MLCEDYRQCAEALQHWNQSLDEDAPARMQEYRALLQELEDEISQNINYASAIGMDVSISNLRLCMWFA